MKNPEKFELEKEKEFELSPEDEEIVLDIINHPMVQKGLARYKIFSEAYFEQKGEFKKMEKEAIKQRADSILSEDAIYLDILKSGRPIKNEDFIKYVPAELKKEGIIDELKKAKKEGKFDKFLKNFLIERQIKKERVEREKKRIVFEKIGKMWVEVVNNECRPHLPRIAENWPGTLKGMKESYEFLAKLLQTDERFSGVERIEVISWIFGQKKIAKDYDKRFRWNFYTKEEIEKFAKEKPEAYEDLQKIGIEVSPKLFKKYLLTEELPEIGGRRIKREEFIERMKGLKQQKEAE